MLNSICGRHWDTKKWVSCCCCCTDFLLHNYNNFYLLILWLVKMVLCAMLRMIWQWVNILRGQKFFLKVKRITVGAPRNIRRVYFPVSLSALCFLVTFKVTDIKQEKVIRAAAALAALRFAHSSTERRVFSWQTLRLCRCAAATYRTSWSFLGSQPSPTRRWLVSSTWPSVPGVPALSGQRCSCRTSILILITYSSFSDFHPSTPAQRGKKTPRASSATTVALRPPPLPASFLSLWYTSKFKKTQTNPISLHHPPFSPSSPFFVCCVLFPPFCLFHFSPLFFFFPAPHLSEPPPKSKHYTECQWQDNGLFVVALLNTVMLMLDPLSLSVLLTNIFLPKWALELCCYSQNNK